ncbi:unnamed protein product [Tilletia laevis]|uniref:Cutinase n=3 Tax=Tilletia TaxID=13289 RepID=A0ABN7J4A6_9BASI|nr:hypothetical protein CF336_g4478 [Tilletia laevis]CAD6887224.1 unnamed protein product [Tilletia caries]CAD6972685.1 unnamed protein product [Tilletia controversa]KAE8202235.1 hypothetical protein CF335_g3497 [Tilletia laevis]CAD6913931.1 unnamed protein product [Tilletia laevis]
MMLASSTAFLTFALSLLNVAEAASVNKHAELNSAAGCHDYVIIDSRATTEAQGPSVASKGMIQKTLSALPGGTSAQTVYPASFQFQVSAGVGAAWVHNYLKQGIASCPKQKYALVGYGQGAAVTWKALANVGTDDPLHEAIKAIVLLGDPYHLPHLPGNIDDHEGNSTDGAQGFGVKEVGFPGSEKITPWAKDGKVLNICALGDQVCQYSKSSSEDFGPHKVYKSSAQVQDAGAKFLTQKLGGKAGKGAE